MLMGGIALGIAKLASGKTPVEDFWASSVVEASRDDWELLAGLGWLAGLFVEAGEKVWSDAVFSGCEGLGKVFKLLPASREVDLSLEWVDALELSSGSFKTPGPAEGVAAGCEVFGSDPSLLVVAVWEAARGWELSLSNLAWRRAIDAWRPCSGILLIVPEDGCDRSVASSLG